MIGTDPVSFQSRTGENILSVSVDMCKNKLTLRIVQCVLFLTIKQVGDQIGLLLIWSCYAFPVFLTLFVLIFKRPIRQRVSRDREINASRICCKIHQEETSWNIATWSRSWGYPEGDPYLGRDGTRQRYLPSSGSDLILNVER